MLFIVDQRQFAVIYALGEIKEVVTEPGLKFKLPPPFQNVVLLDRRVQTLDSPESRPIFTAEKKSLVIDWLIKWRMPSRASSSATAVPTRATSRTVSPRGAGRVQRRGHQAHRDRGAGDRA
jgi:regulator of protease activity HflC (stomatin/prohibitin superfamily)